MDDIIARLNPNKTSGLRELGQVDITKLKSMVSKLGEELWQIETKARENEFKVFHHTQHIIFRFPDTSITRLEVHDNPSWTIWKPFLMPIMEAAVEPYNYKKGQFKAVMLAKLKAGYSIDMHRDGLPEYYFLHKIHVPIQTNDQVTFHIKPQNHFLKEGIAYEVNNLLPHYVTNKGEEDRIHLIFEYVNGDFQK